MPSGGLAVWRSGGLAVWRSGGLAGLGRRIFLTAGSVLGIGGSFVAFPDGRGDDGWVLGLHGRSGWGWSGVGLLVGVIVGLLDGIPSLLKFPTHRGLSSCLRLFFLFVYMQ